MTERECRRGPRPARGKRWLATGFRLVVVATVLLAMGAPAASAAGQTAVKLETAATDVAVGETVAVDLVVSSTERGVGGFVADLELGNSNVADVVDVQFHGDPGMSDVVHSDDGARFGAVLMDTSETGSVTVATVTLRAKAPGSTQIGLEIDPLADEDGNVYDVETSGALVQATGSGEPAAPPDDDGDSDSSDEEIDLGGFGSDAADDPSPQAAEDSSTSGADGASESTADSAPTSTPQGAPETADDAPPASPGSPTTDPEAEQRVTGTGGQPGFGLLVGGTSLAVVAMLARRR